MFEEHVNNVRVLWVCFFNVIVNVIIFWYEKGLREYFQICKYTSLM